jgi:hypothetical protein
VPDAFGADQSACPLRKPLSAQGSEAFDRRRGLGGRPIDLVGELSAGDPGGLRPSTACYLLQHWRNGREGPLGSRRPTKSKTSGSNQTVLSRQFEPPVHHACPASSLRVRRSNRTMRRSRRSRLIQCGPQRSLQLLWSEATLAGQSPKRPIPTRSPPAPKPPTDPGSAKSCPSFPKAGS